MGAKTLEAQIAKGIARANGDVSILTKLASPIVDFEPRFEIMPGAKAHDPDCERRSQRGSADAVHRGMASPARIHQVAKRRGNTKKSLSAWISTRVGALIFSSLLLSGVTWAQDGYEENLAQQLSNPVASLISVPFQFNYNSGFGPNDGDQAFVNIQPVLPFSLNDDWNLISRTILPVVWQEDVAGPSGEQFGLGDTIQSLFFSPANPTASGIIWGVGPVFLFPTATDDLLGAEKWGAGPSGVALRQSGPWTVGVLANHIWSFAGDSDRADVSSTFMQPFVTYTTDDAWTFALNTESSYNWEAEAWSVPINLTVSKLVVIETQPISLFAGTRYWAESPENGPDGFGFRTGITFLFPANRP